MFKNYIKLAWRNLIRNRVASFINIGGLSVGLATGIVMMLWMNYEWSMDKFHAHLDSICLLKGNSKQAGVIRTGDALPGRIGPILRDEMPELEYVARTTGQSSQLLRSGDKNLYEQGIYAEPDYFRIMTYPAIAGDPVAALRDVGSVVITQRTAQKLFGNENPIGKVLVHENTHTLKVAAVIRDVPENSSIRFDVVLPFRLFEKQVNWVDNWDYYSLQTWMQLKPGASLAGLNSKLKNLLQAHKVDTKTELFAYPLAKLHLYNDFSNGKPDGGRIGIVILLGVIGLFVLLIACINFMNLSTARSEYRAREVGVRKTLGASRMTIILQFLSEALLITFFALLLGISLTKWFLPHFSQFTSISLSFDFSNGWIWMVLLALGILTGVVAGSYPALFLSRFHPAKVLKGAIFAKKGTSVVRKGLVTFQFVIAIFLIISTIVIYREVNHLQHRPIGYDPANLVTLPLRGDMVNKYPIVQHELEKIPGVESVSAGSDDLIHFGGSTTDVAWPGKTADQNFMVFISWVRYNWSKTAGLTMAEGRDFSPLYGADTSACLLNQAAVKSMGLKEPVPGTRLGSNTIIGVVQDFAFNDASKAAKPLVIYLSKGDMAHVFIRLRNDERWQTAITQIGQAMKRADPNYPFEFHFTNEQYDQLLNGIRSTGQLLNGIGILAIFISCLGLFGLSGYLAERRTKEIGIRKVLGASVAKIWFLLSKEFLKPVILAFLIAAPLAGWTMQKMLEKMDYRVGLSWWIFAAGGGLAICIALLTVSFQGIKAAGASPVKSLRSE